MSVQSSFGMSQFGIKLNIAPVAAAALMALAGRSYGASATWQATVSSGSSWVTPANWSAAVPGNISSGVTASTDNATFGDAVNKTVQWDSGRTVNTVTFNNTSGDYSLSGTGSLYLGGASGNNVIGMASTGSSGITNRVTGSVILTSGAGIAFSNSSASSLNTLVISGNVSSGANGTGLQLKGTNTGLNTISGVISSGGFTGFSIGIARSTGSTGTWVLSNSNNSYTGTSLSSTQTQVANGTLIAGADAPNGGAGVTGAFGNSTSAITVGAAGGGSAAQANASLLAGMDSNGYTIGRNITVQVGTTGGDSFTDTLGAYNTAGTSKFTGNITLNHAVVLQAATGGTAEFSTGTWATNGNAVTVGSASNTGVVRINNDLTTAGGITVSKGTLQANSNITASVKVAAGATLGGSGTIAGAITANAAGDAGLVSPGASPGILTATSVAGGTGLGFGFEFTKTGAPTYSSATSPGNDLVHLTGPSPFAGSLTLGNVVSVYLPATVADGQTYIGGFFADTDANFQTDVGSATFNYYALSVGGPITFNGNSYASLALLNLKATESTYTELSAAFASGTIGNGKETQFTISTIPEPTSIAGLGLLFGTALSRRRRR